MAQDGLDERVPLLPDPGRSESLESTQLFEEVRPNEESNPPGTNDVPSTFSRLQLTRNHLHKYKALYIIGLFLFIVDIPGFSLEVAELGMLQIAVCRKYYSKLNGTKPMDWQGDIPEELCQIPAVQAELAELRGIRQTLYFAIATTLLIPFGVLADTVGRRKVLIVCMLGIFLSGLWTLIVLYFNAIFPLKAVYFSTAFVIIGGGVPLLLPLLHAAAADAAPEEIRTKAFFYLSIIPQLSELYSPVLGSALMKAIGPYGTGLFGLCFVFVSILTLPFLPETLRKQQHSEIETPHHQEQLEMRPGFHRLFASRVREQYHHIRDHVWNDVLPLIHQRLIIFTLVATLINQLLRIVSIFLMQYMVARFHWRVETSPYIMALQAIIQILMFGIVLPPLTTVLVTINGGNVNKGNLILSKGSCVFLCVGSFGMFLAPTEVSFMMALSVTVLGCGFGPAIRSFIASLVTSDELGLVYTVIGFFSSLGVLIVTPVIAASLSWGLRQGGLLVGLPFLMTFILYVISTLFTWLLYVPSRPETDDEE